MLLCKSDTALVLENEICCDPLHCAEDNDKDENNYKINQVVDPGPWIDLSTDDVAYWVDCGPTVSINRVLLALV